MGQFLALHETFGLRQEERYERFVAVLNAARMAFRKDKAVLAELERFKRPSGRNRRSKEESEAA
jgi:predicted phosphoadenosine phosphosulfate sulfurtransferase